MDFNVYRRVVEKKAWGILSYIVMLEEWHKARDARFKLISTANVFLLCTRYE